MDQIGFWNRAESTPSRTAVITSDGTEITFAELDAQVNRVCHGLRARGVRPGDTIASVLPNGVPMVVLYLAAMQSGLYLVTLNYHLTAYEIGFILSDSSSRLVVCDAEREPICRKALAETGGDGIELHVGIDELEQGQPSSRPTERPGGTVMQYTSGTTGRPKGVKRPLSGADADAVARTYAWLFDEFGLDPAIDGAWLVASPMYHSANITMASGALHMGWTLVLMRGWDAETFLELVQRHRVTGTHVVPTQLQRLVKLPAHVRERYDTSSLTHVIHGAAPCPMEVKHAALEWLGPVIYEYYGSTEVGTTLAKPQDWLERPGTVGRPFSICELKILDSQGRELEPGQVGQIYMRQGDDRMEYHNDPDKTAEARRDGFVTVGDMGYVDEDGFLFLQGRATDMIIAGGVNIYPAEIESVLVTHPDVVDAAVIGIPDEDLGEQVKAVIQLAPGVDPEEARASLEAFCADRLARFKQPRTIDFVSELPRDPNGKLYKNRVRAWYPRSTDS